MIFAWLTARFLGISRGFWLLGIVFALGSAWIALSARENADDKHNQQVGREIQRAEDLAETLDRVEQANEAAEDLKRNPDAARAECLQNARNKADC